jgi:uncharacterized protein YjiS (DUF1127 family)
MACSAEIETGIASSAPRAGLVLGLVLGLGRRIGRLVDFVMRAGEVARQRRALMRLDDRMLKDIGASRADAYREGSRSWWDLPASDR